MTIYWLPGKLQKKRFNEVRIALLNTQKLVTEWFRKDYPEVEICCKADERFLHAEVLILTSNYEIENMYFQILDLWKMYLKKNAERKRLCLLGWKAVKGTTPNYLHVEKMPESLLVWARNTQKVLQNPYFPELVDENIIPALAKIMHSHGNRALQQLLIQLRLPLHKLEIQLRKGYHPASENCSNDIQQTQEIMDRLKVVWEIRNPWFSLMPDYPRLLEMEQIFEDWQRLKEGRQLATLPLSERIGDFLEDVVSEITDFYNMEK